MITDGYGHVDVRTKFIEQTMRYHYVEVDKQIIESMPEELLFKLKEQIDREYERRGVNHESLLRKYQR